MKTAIIELSNEDILRITNKPVEDVLKKWAEEIDFHNYLLKGKLEITLEEINN
jgi:hypothetical protein